MATKSKSVYSHKNCGMVSSGAAVPCMTVAYKGMQANAMVHAVVSMVGHIQENGCVLTPALIVRPLLENPKNDL